MADEQGTLLLDVLYEDVDRLKQMELGSEEHHRATEDVAKLYRVQLDEINIGLEESTRQAKMDYDFERMRLDDKRKQDELEVRNFEAEVEDRKSKRDFWGKLAGIGAVFGLTIGTFIYEDRDNIMPRNKLKFTDKIKFW